MKKLVTLVLVLASAGLSGLAQTQFPEGSENLFNSMMKSINTRHVNWVKQTAAETNQKQLTEVQVKTKATEWGVLGSLNGADIEALAFLVLMQAAKSAQEDLKAIMASVKSINNAKAKQREALSKMQSYSAKGSARSSQLDSVKFVAAQTQALLNKKNPELVKFTKTRTPNQAVTKAELDNQIDQIKNDLDSMSEMGEMESLRLQMAMDRMSKMMSTLSNLLKKISDTASQITQNLK